MDYVKKYKKYKEKYFQLKILIGGNIPDWFNQYIAEVQKIQRIALDIDKNHHNFLVAGSNAVIFYLNELITVDSKILSVENRTELLRIASIINKPNDLDFKYKNNGTPLFHQKIDEVKTAYEAAHPAPAAAPGKFSFKLEIPDINVETCPTYIDIEAFRACLPAIGEDAMFKKVSGKHNIFGGIDFDRLKWEALRGSTINDTLILGLDDLIKLYTINRTHEDDLKMAALDLIHKCVNTAGVPIEIIAKYTGLLIHF
jgi:hypothetical protein